MTTSHLARNVREEYNIHAQSRKAQDSARLLRTISGAPSYRTDLTLELCFQSRTALRKEMREDVLLPQNSYGFPTLRGSSRNILLATVHRTAPTFIQLEGSAARIVFCSRMHLYRHGRITVIQPYARSIKRLGTNMSIVPPMYIQFEYKSIDNISHFSFTRTIAALCADVASWASFLLSKSRADSNTSNPEKHSILWD